MSSYGKVETERLKQNLENQLERLVEQLEDLENCKYTKMLLYSQWLFYKLLGIFREDLELEEYEETKNDTMEQLKELHESLNKLVKGDISLISALGAVQLVIHNYGIFQTNYCFNSIQFRQHKRLYHKRFKRRK